MTLANSLSQAKRLERIDNLQGAAKIYGEILARYPKSAKARKALENLTKRLRQAAEPTAVLQAELAKGFAAGQYHTTATRAAGLVRTHRQSHFLWTLLGRCYLPMGALDKAASCLTRACELDPKSAASLTALGDVLKQQSKLDAAIVCYTDALALDPNDLPTLNNLGNALSAIGQHDKAAHYLYGACQLAPQNSKLLFNYANILRQRGNLDAAKQLYAKATDTTPSFAAAHYNHGQVEVLLGNHLDAIDSFEATLRADPSDDRARVQKLHQMAHINDWRWLNEYHQHRQHLGLRGTGCAPFALLAMEDNPDLLLRRTQAYAGQQFADVAPPMPAQVTRRPKRLRIGYFSADFHAHATMHLMGGLFEHHDRNRFEIFAYSYGPEQQDSSRKRIQENVSTFHQMHGLSDAQIVETALADNLDIAVDLKGYTGDNRSAIFATRLAPVHISYLGYPGTMASPAFDYLIGDHTVCPPGSERHYTEHLIRMPHSYQVNDDKRQISGRQFTRHSCGLPDNAFVFCSFNNSYKITPREFDIWMPLLAQVEGSVLWFLHSNPTSEANLRREAEARGIDPTRLVFASRMPQPDHLARQKVADLFLDTFTYNAHTTASDALWAGLPVLTLVGQQFAARVGASLLTAINLPELITHNEAEYQARAIELATSSKMMMALRSDLRAKRLTSPLFNTADFARDLERGFDMAFERHRKGLAPDHLNVLQRPVARRKQTAQQAAAA